MRRTRKKSISILVALTFLLGLVFAYAGPAAAATYCEFTGGYTDVIADDGQAGGTAEVRQAKKDSEFQWDKAGVRTVLVSVKLPDGVEYSEDPKSDTYVNNYVSVTGATYGFISGSSDYLEIRLPETGLGTFNNPVAVVFNFSTAGKSTLDIDSDFTGEVKAVVEVVGLDAGGAVKFRESEAITVARVAADKTITITAATPKTVAVGNNREGAKITVSETIANAVYSGSTQDIMLEIVTSGVTFGKFDDTKVKGIRRGIEDAWVSDDDAAIAYVDLGNPTVGGLPSYVEIAPVLNVTPAATGDIKIRVTAYKQGSGGARGDKVSETVTVAQATDKVSFTVSDIKNTGGKVYAGHGVTTLKEAGKEAEFTIKPATGGKFPADMVVYVDITGAKFAETGFSGAAVNLYNESKSAWFEPGSNTDKVTLKTFKVQAPADAAEGDIVLKLSSNIGTFEPAEVVIGKVAKPITVTASAAPAVAYLGKGQAAGDITIKEAKDAAIKEDGLRLALPDGVKFAAKPSVKVSDGNIKVSSALAEDDSVLLIKLDTASSTASTITVSDIKYDVNRLALDGDVTVKVWTRRANESADPVSGEWADKESKLLATVVNAKVVSAAKREAAFVIGSTTYTVNGEDKTMDVAPYIDTKTGRTMLPVRYVALALGVAEDNIFWDAQARAVTLLKGDRAVQMTIGSKALLINGITITMDAAPEIKDGRTMLPFRWVAQALGASVSWDEATKTVTMKIE